MAIEQKETPSAQIHKQGTEHSWWQKWGHLVCTIVLILIYSAIALVYSNDSLDDHWITYRYARNLARGEGLVWNIGERPVEGYTCFLWVIINSFFLRLGIFPLLGSKILSLLSGIAMIVAVFSPLNKAVTSLILRLMLALLISLCPVLLFYGQSGMETLFFTAFIFLGTLVWIGSRAQTNRLRSLLFSSLMYSCAVLTRPEGLLIFIIVLLHEFDYARRSRKEGTSLRQARSELLIYCTPALVIVVCYFAWRLTYYGYLFPNTYYAKHSGNRLNNLPLGVLFIGQAFSIYLIAPVALLTGLLVNISIAGPWRKIILPLVTIPAVYVAYIMWMGGDDTAAFPSVRLLAPVIPIIYLVLVIAFEESLKSATPRKQITLSAIAVILCVLCWASDGLNLLKLSNPEVTSTIRPSALISLVARKIHQLNKSKADELSLWIVQHTKPEDTIAVPWAGRVPYYTDRPVLDMLGLNDLHIAHLEPKQRGIDVKMDPVYVLARKPKMIFVNVNSTYWRGEASFKEAGGWKLGDQLLLDLLRKSSDYIYVKDVPTKITVFLRVTSDK